MEDARHPPAGWAEADLCAQQPATDGSRLTLLRSAKGLGLCKEFYLNGDGSTHKTEYPREAWFYSETLQFAGLHELLVLLRPLQLRRDTCLIRGTPGPRHPGPGQQ